ncbi:MAG: glycosyltransferase family 4 protein [Rhodovarius sp.]|nr:glycosyltransferase family 4 protein [Rhodovarius sp.]
MTAPLFINGRFRLQGLSGVQRFAAEITAQLPEAVVLTPPPGRLAGHLWEQWHLPRAAQAGLLLNLGNTAPLLRRGRQAVVIHDAGVFDTPESYSLSFRLFYRTMHRVLARNGTRILTVSAFSRGRLARALGLPEEAIGIVPEGGEHILRPASDAQVLSRHGLLPGRYALVVGTGAAHKNLTVLAGAVDWLAARGMTLALAGARDAAVFRDGGALAGARPLGRVSDGELRALYENAFCLLFPSRYEGFGIPPLEAMCCGCPVLAARAGAVPEVCGEAALWFDPQDPRSLLAGLEALPERREGLRQAGFARARLYSWPAAAARLLTLAEEARA